MSAIVLVAVSRSQSWASTRSHGKPKYGPMQHSPYEIKEKLLKALDEDYNVVDMAVVIEVISLLEKTSITKDTLEKTRLGKYVNELRKRTNNEQLARRAKDLVKSWRKLLSQSDSATLNGERIPSGANTPPVGLTTSGPGPGPGFGPGPGPGNKLKSSCINPAVSRYKPSSPAVTTSPVCSSASNSPLPPSKLQGLNRPATPSTYAPVSKVLSINQSTPLSRTSNTLYHLKQNLVNKGGSASNQVFKPVSPTLTTTRHDVSSRPGTPGSASGPVAQPKPLCPAVSPALWSSNSRSCSPCVNAPGRTLSNRHYDDHNPVRYSSQSSTPSPPLCTLGAHSSLDLARTNAANKRLRKNDCVAIIPSKKIPEKINSLTSHTSTMVNGMDFASSPCEGITHSESSAFDSFKLFESFKSSNYYKSNIQDKHTSESLSTNSQKKKRKNISNTKSDYQEKCREKLITTSSSKLPRVKTTQQLIADLQAKKGSTLPSTAGLIPNISSPPTDCVFTKSEPSVRTLTKGSGSLQSSDAEVNKMKSELLTRFLESSSEGPPIDDNARVSPVSGVASPLHESSQPLSDFGSVSNIEKAAIPYVDPVSIEIQNIIASLPEVNSSDINWDDDYVPSRTECSTEESVERILLEKWEYVNGNYDSEGTWKPWQEVCERGAYSGEILRILPYVNTDW